MCADGDQRPLPADVLVELVLQVDERVIGSLREGDVSEDGRREEGPDLLRLSSMDSVRKCETGWERGVPRARR